MKDNKIENKTHGRIVWCPNNCSFQANRRPERLRVKNISITHKRKYCRFCKRKLDIIRSDTPEGRALKQKQWYEANVQPTLKHGDEPKGPTKTAAQRMKEMRDRRKAEAMEDGAGVVLATDAEIRACSKLTGKVTQ